MKQKQGIIVSAVVGAATGALLGAGIAWYWVVGPAPWMSFDDLQATYVRDSRQIGLSGHYQINRPCPDAKKIVLRVEALATDGQIAMYGPKPGVPDVTEGRHVYVDSLPLLQAIEPDGWIVRAIITCPGELEDTIVSPSATVLMSRNSSDLARRPRSGYRRRRFGRQKECP